MEEETKGLPELEAVKELLMQKEAKERKSPQIAKLKKDMTEILNRQIERLFEAKYGECYA